MRKGGKEGGSVSEEVMSEEGRECMHACLA